MKRGLKPLPDYLRPRLKLVFVGFNPGLHSARRRHYYAGPRNQFWALLFESGLVAKTMGYSQDAQLLELGMGLTDIVKRPTRGAKELRTIEIRQGARVLQRKLERYQPDAVAFVGKGVYAKFIGSKSRKVDWGFQPETIGRTRLFCLPSTSGANTSLPHAEKLEWFRKLREWLPAISR